MDSQRASGDCGGATDMDVGRQHTINDGTRELHLMIGREQCMISLTDNPVSSMRVLLRKIVVKLDELAYILLHTNRGTGMSAGSSVQTQTQGQPRYPSYQELVLPLRNTNLLPIAYQPCGRCIVVFRGMQNAKM